MHAAKYIRCGCRRLLTSNGALTSLKRVSRKGLTGGLYLRYFRTNHSTASSAEIAHKESSFESSVPSRQKPRFSEPATVQVIDDYKVQLVWGENQRSTFHVSWLRRNCHCTECRQPFSGQWTLPLNLPDKQTLIQAYVKDGNLELELQGEPRHNVQVPLGYLREHDYSISSLDARALSRRSRPAERITKFDFSSLRSQNGLWQILKALSEDGVTLVRDVPTEDKYVKKVALHFGPIQECLYGEVFDVRSDPQPINIAYSSIALPLHQDIAYFESPPGLQFQHCVRFDAGVLGGESQVLDVMHAAEELRNSYPELFRVLCNVPATFQKIHLDRVNPTYLSYQRPHIVVNHRDEVVAVNWAPAFEGPLQVPHEVVDEYYKAYSKLQMLINESDKKLEMRMRPGDLLIFNNRRMLHGRTAFTSNNGVRHLQGCYVSVSDFANKHQVLSKTLQMEHVCRRLGDQDYF